MDEINEQTENMKQIQEALATPIGSAADFDEVSFYFGSFKALLVSMEFNLYSGSPCFINKN